MEKNKGSCNGNRISSYLFDGGCFIIKGSNYEYMGQKWPNVPGYYVPLHRKMLQRSFQINTDM